MGIFSLTTTVFNSGVALWTAFEFKLADLQQSFVQVDGGFDYAVVSGSVLRAAVGEETRMSQMLFDMMVPGWLFSGFITGQVMGLLVPLIQNYILLQVIFGCRCLPAWINKAISLIIPYNPDPTHALSARDAEKIFQPGEVCLAWEYADKIVNPSICLISFFFLSPQMWRIFPWLLQWACFIYLYHRFFLIWTRKKNMHDARSLQICGLYMWFLPLGIIATAWAFWTVRLGYFSSLILVPVAFWMSTIIYFMVLLITIPIDSKEVIEKDKSYELVNSRLLYNWFNCNAVHVLKSRYGMLNEMVLQTSSALVPFFFGKEYLVIDKMDEEDELELAQTTSPTNWIPQWTSDEISMADRMYFRGKKLGKYAVPVFCFLVLVGARIFYYRQANTNILDLDFDD